MKTIVPYLSPIEQNRLQLLSKWWYERGIARIIHSITFCLPNKFFVLNNSARATVVDESGRKVAQSQPHPKWKIDIGVQWMYV